MSGLREKSSRDKSKQEWKPYTLVWAKVPGFPYWPGVIIPKELYPISMGPGTDKQLGVVFYGSMDYSWVRIDQLRDFDSNFVNYGTTKRKDLEKAILHSQETNPIDLVTSLPQEVVVPEIINTAVISEPVVIESPKKSTAARKSKRKRVFHTEIDKIVKIKTYLAHRIYGIHTEKIDIDKIDKAISWLSSLTNITYKIIEDSRIGHVLSYIALKPPNNQIGAALEASNIPLKCKVLIEKWKLNIIKI